MKQNKVNSTTSVIPIIRNDIGPNISITTHETLNKRPAPTSSNLHGTAHIENNSTQVNRPSNIAHVASVSSPLKPLDINIDNMEDEIMTSLGDQTTSTSGQL